VVVVVHFPKQRGLVVLVVEALVETIVMERQELQIQEVVVEALGQ
jgi:hypothetical protein